MVDKNGWRAVISETRRMKAITLAVFISALFIGGIIGGIYGVMRMETTIEQQPDNNGPEDNPDGFQPPVDYTSILGGITSSAAYVPVITDAAAFNVTENVVYLSRRNTLAIRNENLTYSVPYNWTSRFMNLNITSIYEEMDYFNVFKSQNGNFTNTLSPWTNETNYPASASNLTSVANGVYFGYNTTYDYAYADYHIGLTDPKDMYGYFVNNNTLLNRGGYEVETGALIEPEKSVYPIDNDFSADPGYTVLVDPYGNSREQSSVSATWRADLEALETSLDISDSLFFKGDPSVAFGTPFYIPFEPDSVTVTFSWSVENLGYESGDDFEVLARIDNNYIDGRYGANGTDYTASGGTQTALESDEASGDVSSHDYWVRTYNVTDMLGNYGWRAGWHYLDFGCYMAEPDEGDDDVNVYWDFIKINVTHYDWYQSAVLSFEYIFQYPSTVPTSGTPFDFVVYVGGITGTSSVEYRYYINATNVMPHGDWFSRRTITIRFPQQYKDAFAQDTFWIKVGLEEARYRPGKTSYTSLTERMCIDTFSLNIRYILGSPSRVGLQGSFDGVTWFNVYSVNSYNISFGPPGFQMAFRLTVSPYDSIPNPYIRFRSYIIVNKTTIDGAKASVYLTSWNDTEALWNVTYNNTQSVNEFDNLTFVNNRFYYYEIIFHNLPAFDGAAPNSTDWDLREIYAPNGVLANSITEVQAEGSPFYQKVILKNATTGVPGNLLRGVWVGHAYQPNYLMNATLYHTVSGTPGVFYDGDATNYTLQVRNATGVSGHYRVVIKNATGDVIPGFPRYHDAVENYTGWWTVDDNGVGIYRMQTIWNDTDTNGRTLRIGWYNYDFELHRHTVYTLQEYPDGLQVISGNTVTYHLQFNYTVNGGGGVENATILAYRNDTGNLWGEDWPPYEYQIESVVYTGGGNYSVTLKTAGIPNGNYTIHFVLMKDYYDTKYTVTTWLNITGLLYNMSIDITSGAFVSGDTVYLYENNLPTVNDTSKVIQFTLTNESDPTQRIRDAQIRASFNGSNIIMTAIEQYSFTFLESDKGVYNLTMDTTGLHATDNVNYFNYTLEISFGAQGFAPVFMNITVKILPAPISIDIQPIGSVYENETFKVDATVYTEIGDIRAPCDWANVYWSISNETGEIYSGTSVRVISNLYSAEIDMNAGYYLYPGNYTVTVTANGTDLEDGITVNTSLTILPKALTELSIQFPSEVRIGAQIQISVKLMNVTNASVPVPIPDKQIILVINYSATYSYSVLKTTSATGSVTHTFTIPESIGTEKFEGQNLTVTAEFSGDLYYKPSVAVKQQVILGKRNVTMEFVNPPASVRVGYNATFTVNLSIEGIPSVDGKFVFLTAVYDYYPGGNAEPFLYRQLTVDTNATASYTIDMIEDGHINLTIFFEFFGDTQIKNGIINMTFTVLPKWKLAFKYAELPDEIRLGQTVELNFTLYPLDSDFSETVQGLKVAFEFDYGSYTQTLYYFTDTNGSVYFEYDIPDSGVNSLTLRVIFPGTDKIAETSVMMNRTILPKKATVIQIKEFSGTRVFTGTYFISANLTDEDGNPIAGLNVTFLVYLGDTLIGEYKAVTNEYGHVSVTIKFDKPGDYRIEAVFESESIYAESQSASVSIHVVTYWTLFLENLPTILLLTLIAVSSIVAFHRLVVVPRRIRRLEALKAIHQRFADVENIQYILILTKSGLSLFSRSFTNVPIDETLISGFLSAISSFGAEIGSKMKKVKGSEKGLEQLSYKQFKIIVNDVALVRTALLLLKDASPTLKEKLKRFNLEFQEKFMDVLEDWNGQALPEAPIMELIEKHLEVDLLYPHRVNLAKVKEYMKGLDKKSMERLVLTEAMKPDVFNNTFYIREMINHLRGMGKEDIHIFNAIVTLRRDGIVFAINPRTQYLIDQFKPIIDKLPKDAKTVIIRMIEGVTSESKLRKDKRIRNLDESLELLRQMGLIGEDNKLTDAGEAVGTLLKLMGDLL